MNKGIWNEDKKYTHTFYLKLLHFTDDEDSLHFFSIIYLKEKSSPGLS